MSDFGEDAAARGDRSWVAVASSPRPEASVRRRVAIRSMKAPVPPAHVPFMRCSGGGVQAELGVLAAQLDDDVDPG